MRLSNSSQIHLLIGSVIKFKDHWGNEMTGRLLGVRAFVWMEPEEYELIVEVLTEDGKERHTVQPHQLMEQLWA